MTHADSTIEQAEMTRNLNRILGGSASTKPWVSSQELHAVIDALLMVPQETRVTVTSATAGNNEHDVTVPASEIWLLDTMESRNETNAVRQNHEYRPREGASFTLIATDAPAANVRMPTFPPRPVVLFPGATVRAAFLACTLNDVLVSVIGWRRFSL